MTSKKFRGSALPPTPSSFPPNSDTPLFLYELTNARALGRGEAFA